MKFLVVALVMCASFRRTWCLSEDDKQMMMDIHNACLAESGVSSEVVQKAMSGEFMEDVKLKDHLVCFAKKEGVMSDSGDVMEDVVRQKIHAYINDEAKADEAISKCLVKMDSPQETAFHISKCMFGMVEM